MDKHSMDRNNLVTIVEDQIPIYKLRAESDKKSENKNIIKTPLLDQSYNLNLSPEFLFETLKYFVDCGERLTQMTKTYDDIDAVTRLLEEKEKDLELAARIGQSLLEQNSFLRERVDQLECDNLTSNETIDKLNYELLRANDLIVQLKHDLSNKNGLIQMFNELENEETEPNKNDFKDKTSLTISWQNLHDKVLRLEDENNRLRREATVTNKEIEIEEKKEIYLIRDCAKQLTDANLKLMNLQEELTKRSEDSITQQEEITDLLTQSVELQRICRDLSAEKEGLEAALHLSNECQNELSCELIELKDKYDLLLKAFHELKEELKRNKNDKLKYLSLDLSEENCFNQFNYIPISESLAAEIESTLESEGYGSEFSSLNTSNLNTALLQNSSLNQYDKGSLDNLTEKSCDSLDSRQLSRCSNENSISSQSTLKSFSLPNKIKMVKPLEGSETLGKWKKLATPHLGVILESQSGVQNRVLKGVDKDLIDFALKAESPESNLVVKQKKQTSEKIINNKFDTTASVFTFTTTSLCQNNDITSVTPSFSALQLATGQDLPITSISSSYNQNSVKKDEIETTKTPTSSPTIEQEPNNLNFSNLISHFIRNTGSYFMTKSKSSDKIKKDSESNIKNSSSIENFDSLLKTTKAVINLTESMAVSKANDSKQVSNGLTALTSLSIQNPGVLMKGSLIANKPLQKDLIHKLINSKSALRLEGLNAVLFDVTNKTEITCKIDSYIGKIKCIKTLRKGGFC